MKYTEKHNRLATLRLWPRMFQPPWLWRQSAFCISVRVCAGLSVIILNHQLLMERIYDWGWWYSGPINILKSEYAQFQPEYAQFQPEYAQQLKRGFLAHFRRIQIWFILIRTISTLVLRFCGAFSKTAKVYSSYWVYSQHSLQPPRSSESSWRYWDFAGSPHGKN